MLTIDELEQAMLKTCFGLHYCEIDVHNLSHFIVSYVLMFKKLLKAHYKCASLEYSVLIVCHILFFYVSGSFYLLIKGGRASMTMTDYEINCSFQMKCDMPNCVSTYTTLSRSVEKPMDMSDLYCVLSEKLFMINISKSPFFLFLND